MESNKTIIKKKKKLKNILNKVQDDRKYKELLQFLIDHYAHKKTRRTFRKNYTDHSIQTIICSDCKEQKSFFADLVL